MLNRFTPRGSQTPQLYYITKLHRPGDYMIPYNHHIPSSPHSFLFTITLSHSFLPYVLLIDLSYSFKTSIPLITYTYFYNFHWFLQSQIVILIDFLIGTH